MKVLATLLALTRAVQAHYVFPSLIYNGVTKTAWQYVRQWTGYYAYGPVTSVTSLDIRCNVNGSTVTNAATLDIIAGQTLGFSVAPDIYHPGPLLVYLAKVPSGDNATTWNGDGDGLTWPTDSATTVSFTIPAQLPSGQYLVRVEHIGLHVAQSVGGAQFYISCGQINVTGGGSGTPSPLVAFPGAYSATDPGIEINIYYPVPTSYTPPGPAVWPSA